MPVGPNILWPEKRVEVAAERLHVDRHVRARPARRRRAPATPRACASATISATGLIVPSAFDTWHDRDDLRPRRRAAARTRPCRSSPRSSIGTTRSARARLARTASATARCSSGAPSRRRAISSPGPSVRRARSVCATRLMPSVRSAHEDDLARDRRVQERAAPSRARPRTRAVARSLSRCTPRWMLALSCR